MAHILIAYKQFPAPSVGHAGGESLFRLMEALHQRGHRLTLVARIADDERSHLPAVEAICERIYTVRHHRSRRGPRPMAFVRSYLELRAEIRRAIRAEHPDFLHVETTQTAVAALGLKRPPASYRTQDVNWFLLDQQLRQVTGPRRVVLQALRGVLRRVEPWVCRRYDLMLVISEGDRQLLAPDCDPDRLLLVPLTPAVSPAVTPAGTPALTPVGTTAVSPAGTPAVSPAGTPAVSPAGTPAVSPAGTLAAGPVSASAEPPAIGGEANLLFVGAMSRDHNRDGITWFLDNVWDHVLDRVPEAHLLIVGGHPPEALQARADGDRIVVTGFVDDLAAWYRAATLFVSPLLVAGGLLQKVVDAMAMGVPVVATSVCNHGVGAVPGEHLLTADEPIALAGAICDLLSDPEARARIGRAGQRFVAAHYDLAPAVDRWDGAIKRMSEKARKRESEKASERLSEKARKREGD